ncbi:hypothetical protein evm_013196 [Chilo suppressalis]|nr:hypothetical protein evm_013196 [Chilo suppressalis]
MSVNAGVPQGSVLSRTLFLLHINDLIPLGNIHCYADDSTVHAGYLGQAAAGQAVTREKRENLVIELNQACDHISELGEQHFHARYGSSLRPEFQRTTQTVIKTASRKLGVLNKVQRFLKPDQLCLLYKTQMRACVEYCSHLWDGSAKYLLDALDRYVNEVLHYARNNPHVINLLDILEDVYMVKDVDILITEHVPKIKVMDKDIQTEVHPVESYIEKNYSWDMWKWKRRACQWATIVNCKTHSTQTLYSHMRSEIQCQTVEPRDKSLQTKKECGVNTPSREYFLWGLRGQVGYGQHTLGLTDYVHTKKKKSKYLPAFV